MKRIKGGGFAKSFLLSGNDLGLWTPVDLGQGGVKVRSQKSNLPVATEQEQQGRKTSFQMASTVSGRVVDHVTEIIACQNILSKPSRQ